MQFYVGIFVFIAEVFFFYKLNLKWCISIVLILVSRYLHLCQSLKFTSVNFTSSVNSLKLSADLFSSETQSHVESDRNDTSYSWRS